MNHRHILTALLVLAALPLVGAGWQLLATEKDHRRYPPPGELVIIDDDLALHLHTQGRHHRDDNPNSAVVLLDAGTPGFSAQWGWIQPAIAEFATVVSYDRPGLGWSDPSRDEGPNDPRDTADRLHAALHKLGLPGPYLLVGHSYGGLTSRVFATAYPEEISGLVLVDPSHPDQGSRLGVGDPAGSMWFMAPLAHTGALRLGVATGLFDDRIGDLPERQANEAAALFVQPGQWSTVQLELAAWSDIASQLEQAEPLGDRPLTVITAGQGTVEGWHQLHEELAALSSRGIHTTVAEATHLSLLTDPEHARATVEAVRANLAAADTAATKPR
jgi:pimeloyl-ACP methyl ester carboxylesterase